jgi:hypothetical protein
MKVLLMWLYCHGILSQDLTQRLYDALRLWSA